MTKEQEQEHDDDQDRHDPGDGWVAAPPDMPVLVRVFPDLNAWRCIDSSSVNDFASIAPSPIFSNAVLSNNNNTAFVCPNDRDGTCGYGSLCWLWHLSSTQYARLNSTQLAPFAYPHALCQVFSQTGYCRLGYMFKSFPLYKCEI
jgi:hypothetical protein